MTSPVNETYRGIPNDLPESKSKKRGHEEANSLVKALIEEKIPLKAVLGTERTYSDLSTLVDDENLIPISVVQEALSIPAQVEETVSAKETSATPEEVFSFEVHLPTTLNEITADLLESRFDPYFEESFSQSSLNSETQENSGSTSPDSSQEVYSEGMEWQTLDDRLLELLTQGKEEEKRGKLLIALRTYLSATTVAPYSGAPWVEIGNLLFKEDLGQSFLAYKKAIEIDSESSVEPYIGIANIGNISGNLVMKFYGESHILAFIKKQAQA